MQGLKDRVVIAGGGRPGQRSGNSAAPRLAVSGQRRTEEGDHE